MISRSIQAAQALERFQQRPSGEYALNELFLRTPSPDVFMIFVPKCACTTVKHYLLSKLVGDIDHIAAPYYEKTGSRHGLVHALSHEILRVDGRDVLSKQLVTFCRNPYGRLCSSFNNKIANPIAAEELHYKWVRREIVFGYMRRNRTSDVVAKFAAGIQLHHFLDFLANTPVDGWDIHWAPQHALNGFSDIANVDLIRLENFDSEFSRACQRYFGAEPDESLSALEANKTSARRMLTEELAEKIYALFREDFEIFGYDKNSWVDY